MSIVELLLVVSLSSVAVAGLSKAIEKSYVTSNVIETQQITRKFKNSVYHIFNNNCKNFFPNTEPAYYDQNNPAKINKMPYIFNRSNKSESIFKGFIETVDITVSSQNNIHKFNLYYKYSDKATALRNMQTKLGNACTKTDKKGCYHITCNIHAENLDNPPENDDICNPLDCVLDDSASNVLTPTCPPGKFLAGPDNCVGCGAEETLIGTKPNNQNKLEPICLKRACPAGQVAIGINPETEMTSANGKHVIEMDCKLVACPSTSQHKVLNTVTGEMECKTICHGGQRLKVINGEEKCHCPSSMTLDNNGNCTSP